MKIGPMQTSTSFSHRRSQAGQPRNLVLRMHYALFLVIYFCLLSKGNSRLVQVGEISLLSNPLIENDGHGNENAESQSQNRLTEGKENPGTVMQGYRKNQDIELSVEIPEHIQKLRQLSPQKVSSLDLPVGGAEKQLGRITAIRYISQTGVPLFDCNSYA